MKYLNIVVEGNSEEAFVNDILVPHFASIEIYVSTRKIRTGWDKQNQIPKKGGLLKYIKYRNEIKRWIESDRDNPIFWYSSMVDLYAFPKDDLSPYKQNIRSISNHYSRVDALEKAILADIKHPRFIPHIQLHEFESLILVDPSKLLIMYPDKQNGINRLKKEINGLSPEDINESQHTSPSKRIIKYLPDYEYQKAQVGPLVVGDIGLSNLRSKCPHFNNWITKLENIKKW